MNFASAVIGPENNGRGYSLLAGSGQMPPGSWIVDLPMLLLEWGKLQRPEGFAFCFPLDGGGALVGRGQFLRMLSLGPQAYIHLVHCNAAQLADLAFRTERVVAAIPWPDGSTAFGEHPLDLPEAEDPVPDMAWDGLNLAWGSRFLTVEAGIDLDQTLAGALASIAPPSQRQRVAGWMTTSELPVRGSLDPMQACQLVISRDACPPWANWLHPGTVRADRTFAGEPVYPPPAWRIWQAFATLLGAEPDAQAASEALAWRPALERQEPHLIAMEQARVASGHMRPAAMLRVLDRMLDHDERDLRIAGWQVLDEYLAALATRNRADGPVLDLIRSGRAAGHATRMLRHLDSTAVARLDDDDLAMLAETASPAAAQIADTPEGSALLSAILGELAARCRANALAPSSRLVSSLLSLIADWPADTLRRNMAIRGPWLVDALDAGSDGLSGPVIGKTIGPIHEAFAVSTGSAADALAIVGTAMAAWTRVHQRATDGGMRRTVNA